jgi:hypothetical protein
LKLVRLEKLLQLPDGYDDIGYSIMLLGQGILYIDRLTLIFSLDGQLLYSERNRKTRTFQLLGPVVLSIPQQFQRVGYRFFFFKDCFNDGTNIEGLIIST